MTESEKRKKIEKFVKELVSFNLDEESEKKIFLEINKLSPDPQWSDYIFWSDEYFDNNDNFLMKKFLDKIFSYKTIIMKKNNKKEA